MHHVLFVLEYLRQHLSIESGLGKVLWHFTVQRNNVTVEFIQTPVSLIYNCEDLECAQFLLQIGALISNFLRRISKQCSLHVAINRVRGVTAVLPIVRTHKVVKGRFRHISHLQLSICHILLILLLSVLIKVRVKLHLDITEAWVTEHHLFNVRKGEGLLYNL